MSDWIPAPTIENVLIVLVDYAGETDQDARTLDQLLNLTGSRDFSSYVFFAPAEEADAAEEWLAPLEQHAAIAAQGFGSSTDNIAAALRRLFSRAVVQRVVLVRVSQGVPPADLVSRGYAALDEVDVWTVPTKSGALWLVGLRQFPPQLFQQVHADAPAAVDQLETAAKTHNLDFRVGALGL